MSKINLSFLFSKEEEENWNEVMEKVNQTTWWGPLKNAVAEKKSDVEERILREAAQFIEELLADFTAVPFGSRLLPLELLHDFITKHVLESTGQSLEAFYEAGRKVKEAIISGDTYLLLPASLFDVDDIDEVILGSLAASLIINVESAKTFSTIGKYVAPIMHIAAENDDFAEVLFRYGIAEMEEDDTFLVHFDRLMVSFGDLEFVEELLPFVAEGIPLELLWGKQSVFSHAFSASLANALLFGGLSAKALKQEPHFMKVVKNLGEKLKSLDEYVRNQPEPDWDKIRNLCEEIVGLVSRETAKARKRESYIWQMTSEAQRRGIYPDLIVETLALVYQIPVSSEVWNWFEITQRLAIRIAEQATPLQRQPVYWVALTLLRIGTEVEGIENIIKSLQRHVATDT